METELWWKEGCVECERLNKEWVENGKIGTVVPHQHVLGVADLASVPEMIGPETFNQWRYWYTEEVTGARKYYRVPAHLISEVEMGGMPSVAVPEAVVEVICTQTCTQPAKRGYSETSSDTDSSDTVVEGAVRMEEDGRCKVTKLLHDV